MKFGMETDGNYMFRLEVPISHLYGSSLAATLFYAGNVKCCLSDGWGMGKGVYEHTRASLSRSLKRERERERERVYFMFMYLYIITNSNVATVFLCF